MPVRGAEAGATREEGAIALQGCLVVEGRPLGHPRSRRGTSRKSDPGILCSRPHPHWSYGSDGLNWLYGCWLVDPFRARPAAGAVLDDAQVYTIRVTCQA